jgi:hypothetical protein
MLLSLFVLLALLTVAAAAVAAAVSEPCANPATSTGARSAHPCHDREHHHCSTAPNYSCGTAPANAIHGCTPHAAWCSAADALCCSLSQPCSRSSQPCSSSALCCCSATDAACCCTPHVHANSSTSHGTRLWQEVAPIFITASDNAAARVSDGLSCRASHTHALIHSRTGCEGGHLPDD